MALTPKTVTVLLNQGLDTETSELTVPLGRLTTAENVIFDRRVGMFKRPGTDVLNVRILGPVYAEVSGAQALSTRADGTDLVLLTSDDRVLSRDDGGYLPMGSWVNLRTDLLPLPVRPWECTDPSVASAGDRRLVAWEDGRGGVYAQLYSTDGRTLSRDFQVGGGVSRRPSVVAVGSQFVVLYTSGSDLFSAPINVSNPGAPSAGAVLLTSQLSGSGGPGQLYDVAGLDGRSAVLALNSSASIVLGYLGGNGFLQQSGSAPFRPSPITGTAPYYYGPSVAVTPDLAWVTSVGVKSAGDGLEFLKLLPTTGGSGTVVLRTPVLDGAQSRQLVAIASAYDQAGSGDPVFPYSLRWAYELSGSATLTNGPTNNLIRYGSVHWSPSNGFDTDSLLSGTLMQHSHLTSRPFSVSRTDGGADLFVWLTHESPLQSTNFCVRMSDGLIAARSNYQLAVPNVSGVLPNVDVRGNQAYLPVSTKSEVPLPGTSGSTFTGRDLTMSRLTYRATSSWQPVDADSVLYMPGGWLGRYDGAQVTEVGIALAVEGLTLSGTNNVTGGNVSATGTINLTGTFQYGVIPEWTDARGNRELGNCVTFPTVQVAGTGSTVTLTWPTLAHTLKDGTRAPNVSFGVYRTGPNGTVMQRVDDPRSPIVNLTASVSMSYTDNATEGFRASSEVLYTQAEPANVMQASPGIIAASGDRLFLAALEGAPHDWAASKLRLGGTFQFAGGAGGSIDAVGGPITGIKTIDGNVAVFKANKAFQLQAAGTGPSNAAGDTTPWPSASPIVTDTGLPPDGTVLEVAGESDQGLVYWSDVRGPRLLSRGLSVGNVGWQVKQFYGLSVVGGTAPYAREEARLYSSDGTTLVLNTRFDQWSTIPDQQAVGASLWNGLPAYASPDGRVWVENTGSYLDGSTPYSMVIETGWIPLADDLEGMARVWEIRFTGEYEGSPHTFRVELAYDYIDGYVQVVEFQTADALQLSPYGGDGTTGDGSPGFDPSGFDDDGFQTDESSGYGSNTYGSVNPTYRFTVAPSQQRCTAIRLRLSDRNTSGADFSLTQIKLLCGFESNKALLGRARRG